jgi:hypothetical protein
MKLLQPEIITLHAGNDPAASNNDPVATGNDHSTPATIKSAFSKTILGPSIPWLPLSLVGTAVAFYVGFKNVQSYDRIWEARKVYSDAGTITCSAPGKHSAFRE